MNKIILILFLIVIYTNAQEKLVYEANWSSLDQRPIPEWFNDAKFGIFIHWGVYSVPSYTKKGGYAEWYWKGYDNKSSHIWDFHKKTYGEGFKYEEFANLFKAELFNPDDWVKIFANAGAKYIVLTSKHHDGYCLWNSSHSKGWNSFETGPKRDLIGDLFNSLKKTDIKAGLYYSLAEWTNPLYTWTKNRPENNFRKYVDEYMFPQLKDLVEKYKPSVLWADGEWDFDSKQWRSEEFLQWLYNDSPAPNDVVVNDRWGGETRFKHGGYYSTEYTSGLSNTEHPWEECRGMGHSFGFNRNEDVDDYKTSKELIHMLVSLVSNGGNLLLNIGPAVDGTIPVIMQQRLKDIGTWLKVNGSAIYNTRKWIHTNENDFVKYTITKDKKNINAIVLKWPGNELNLKMVKPYSNSKIYLLGYSKELNWNFNDKTGLHINIPNEVRDSLDEKSFNAYSLKIEGEASSITNIPIINVPYLSDIDSTIFYNDVNVKFYTSNEAKYFYTTDGTEPSFKSKKFDDELIIKNDCLLKVFAYETGKVRSLTKSVNFKKVQLEDSKKIKNLLAGVNFKLYRKQLSFLPEFEKLNVDSSGSRKNFDINFQNYKDHYAIVFDAYLKIENDGIYNFYLASDDGSKLYINDKLIVNNDGLHGADKEKMGQIGLKKGFHKIKVEYFENEWDQSLKVLYSSEKFDKKEIESDKLFRK